MALMKLGIVATDIRRSVGGTVFSRNLGGAYTRARVAPVNRNSPKQTAVRANFAANSKLWSGTMTAAQRLAWQFFAASNPLVNVLGASIIVSGLSMAQKLNQRLVQIGKPPILNPPLNLNVPAMPGVFGVVAASGAGTIVVSTGLQAVDTTVWWYVFATRPLAPGKTASSSDFRYVTFVPQIAAAVDFPIGTIYASIFGAWAAGASLSFDIGTIATASGAVTPGQRFNIISS
jgi:hypothetical protein